MLTLLARWEAGIFVFDESSHEQMQKTWNEEQNVNRVQKNRVLFFSCCRGVQFWKKKLNVFSLSACVIFSFAVSVFKVFLPQKSCSVFQYVHLPLPYGTP